MHDLPFFLSNIPFIPASLLQYGYRFITAFVAIIFLLSFGTKYLNSDKNQRMIVCCGNMSLGLYAVHYVLIIPLCQFITSIIPNTSAIFQITIAFFVAILVSYLIVLLLLNNRMFSRFLLGKM